RSSRHNASGLPAAFQKKGCRKPAIIFPFRRIVMMKTKSYLVQDDCRRIIDAASAHARARNWAVTICVCDDGGHILRVERLDGAPPFTAQMAMAKATTAALGRRE